MANEGGDYATVLGSLCLASGQHSWSIYINHVEDSNLFIGGWIERAGCAVSVIGGHAVHILFVKTVHLIVVERG
jgi:hypothetical protein